MRDSAAAWVACFFFFACAAARIDLWETGWTRWLSSRVFPVGAVVVSLPELTLDDPASVDVAAPPPEPVPLAVGDPGAVLLGPSRLGRIGT